MNAKYIIQKLFCQDFYLQESDIELTNKNGECVILFLSFESNASHTMCKSVDKFLIVYNFCCSKRPFSLLYKQFVELVDSLSDLLVQVHKNFIATSVLHDADSTNWPEMKEFYEVCISNKNGTHTPAKKLYGMLGSTTIK